MVAGGGCDLAVKLIVMRHGFTRCDVFLKSVQRAAHRAQLRRTAPLCRQPCRLALHADAQLEHGEHLGEGRQSAFVDPEVARLPRIENEGADAVPGFCQTGRTQARNRLAHDSAADAEFFDDLRLGRQASGAGKDAAPDPRRQLCHQLLGQIGLACRTVWRGLGFRT